MQSVTHWDVRFSVNWISKQCSYGILNALITLAFITLKQTNFSSLVVGWSPNWHFWILVLLLSALDLMQWHTYDIEFILITVSLKLFFDVSFVDIYECLWYFLWSFVPQVQAPLVGVCTICTIEKSSRGNALWWPGPPGECVWEYIHLCVSMAKGPLQNSCLWLQVNGDRATNKAL